MRDDGLAAIVLTRELQVRPEAGGKGNTFRGSLHSINNREAWQVKAHARHAFQYDAGGTMW